jgi:methionine sulfoxide reductase heme-binding subunit
MIAAINRAARWLPTWPVYVLGMVPFAALFWLALNNDLGPNPAEALEKQLGEYALKFLIATLCVTPLRWVGLNLIKFRRALGLLAFAYVTLHLATWVGLDKALRWDEIIADLYKRPYIIIGMVGFAVMLPLAMTSANWAIRRMGPLGWRRLHRLTYVAAIAGALHFVMLKKTWATEPLVYLAIVVALLVARAWYASRQRTVGQV